VADILPIAQAVADAGADAITLSHTIPGMAIDVEARKPILGGITGGLSGPGLKPVSLALVYRVTPAVEVPVIGCGGVFTAGDALEYILAGATAVQVGSASLVDFAAPLNILSGLEAFLGEHGIKEIRELIGAVQRS
jgi:dihydroorotate dehydrogenase (NAD+) catalytic subunit